MNNFNGIIVEYSHVAVDFFSGESLRCSIFFLSHCHADHMTGLASDVFYDRLKDCDDVVLYCSEITKELLVGDDRYKRLKPFVVTLETMVPLSLKSPKDSEEPVIVTLLPAGHCPGSVMFLFEGRLGTVLYTGDFRLSRTDLQNMPPLFTDGRVKILDNVYVDTTFCTRDATRFPKRSKSLIALVELLEPWLAESPDHAAYLSCPAQFGCEYLFVELSKRLGMKVHVAKNKTWKYKAVTEIMDSVTMDGRSTRLHACYYYHKVPGPFQDRSNGNHAEDDCDSPKKPGFVLPCQQSPRGRRSKVLFVRLSTMWFTMASNSPADGLVYRKAPHSYRVFFSMHSSLEEIADVVRFLNPRSIQPLVIPLNSTLEDVHRLLKLDAAETAAETPEEREFGSLKNQGLQSAELGSSIEANLCLDSVDATVCSPLQDKPKMTKSASMTSDGSGVSPKWTFEVSPFKEPLSSQGSCVTVPDSSDTESEDGVSPKTDGGKTSVTKRTLSFAPSVSSVASRAKQCKVESLDVAVRCPEVIDLTESNETVVSDGDSTPELDVILTWKEVNRSLFN